MDSAHYADMPKGFPKVKEMVDALLADPLSTFATSATCNIHRDRCSIPKAEDAMQRMCGDNANITEKEKTAVRKSM